VFGEVIVVVGPERQKRSNTHGSGRILMMVFTHNRMFAECGNNCIDHGCIDAINCVELAEAHSRRLCLCTHYPAVFVGLIRGTAVRNGFAAAERSIVSLRYPI
jgi:hypothetical protein